MQAAVRVVRCPLALPDGLAAQAREELLRRGGAPPTPRWPSGRAWCRDGPDGHFLASYEAVDRRPG